MKKILEHGYRSYNTRCGNCDCYFSYELEDIANNRVECPECGYACVHDCTFNKDFISQIKEQDDE